MKAARVLLTFASLVVVVQANGFSYSSGWSPGQQTKEAAPAPTVVASKPGQTQVAGGDSGGWTSFLTSGPLASLFSRSGINITEKLEEAKKKSELPWDERIPLIRDDNYEELIFNETFTTPEEEEDRLWFLIVTVTNGQRTGLSSFMDEQFNEAYNTSVIEGDLPHVRWGRIDYLNVTRLTTKWVVWKAPMLIVAKDRGKTLRFFQPQQIGGKAQSLRRFLLTDTWKQVEPWKSAWAPGGSREELLHKFALFQETIYSYLSRVPRWLFLIITGGIGSVMLNLFHSKPKPKPIPVKPSVIPTAKTVETPTGQVQGTGANATTSATDSKKAGTQKRKGNKK